MITSNTIKMRTKIHGIRLLQFCFFFLSVNRVLSTVLQSCCASSTSIEMTDLEVTVLETTGLEMTDLAMPDLAMSGSNGCLSFTIFFPQSSVASMLFKC
jgi:hypothetical protein